MIIQSFAVHKIQKIYKILYYLLSIIMTLQLINYYESIKVTTKFDFIIIFIFRFLIFIEILLSHLSAIFIHATLLYIYIYILGVGKSSWRFFNAI